MMMPPVGLEVVPHSQAAPNGRAAKRLAWRPVPLPESNLNLNDCHGHGRSASRPQARPSEIMEFAETLRP